ncbi:2-oxo acid dehydrogenase subunit E2 [Cupriavidus necator]
MHALTVPDLGDFHNLPIIDILIKAGDTVSVEQSLITVESDKATMDVPSAFAGVIREVLVKPGDRVSRGSMIAHLMAGPGEAADAAPEKKTAEAQAASAFVPATDVGSPAASALVAPEPAQTRNSDSVTHVVSDARTLAGPSVRKLGRELGVTLSQVPPTGPKGRVLRQDVIAFARSALTAPVAAVSAAPGGGINLIPWPEIDFSRFGPVERSQLTRVQRISGSNLHRNWVHIPHVTNFDQTDITELEALRETLNRQRGSDVAKLTLLAFVIKACVHALQRFPAFNVSLVGDQVVRKQYFHIGFAADTPNGLVVPVIRDADHKGVASLAEEIGALAALARAGKLSGEQMQGGCLSISSLGGIGGTHFTPIINAPEVAILGIGMASTQPVWDGSAFAPRRILPLSLSWDHRAVDGAQAARFLAHIGGVLKDFRLVTL